MDHEPGDRFDCQHCAGTHTIERSKGLEVTGSSEGLDPTLYVRCPEAGFVSLSDPDATRDDADTWDENGDGGRDGGESDGGNDWP